MNDMGMAEQSTPICATGHRRPPLSREFAQRQGAITSLAFVCLGGREAAIHFLNQPDVALGGRPLDVATADAQGFARVAQAMRLQAV